MKHMQEFVQREIRHRLRAQHGIVTSGQARAAGMSRAELRRKVEQGEWVRVTPRVYRLAAVAESPEQQLWAALLSARPDAVASHVSAAWLWRLLPPPGRHVVTVGRDASHRCCFADIHRTVDYPAHVVKRRGFPCTTPARTLVDLAAVLTYPVLTVAVDRALASQVLPLEGVWFELERVAGRGRGGVRLLREVLGDRSLGSGPGPSALESRFHRLLQGAGIGPLRTEVWCGQGSRYRVDVLVAERVVAEVDGWAFHASPEHKAEDERRRNRLRLDGFLVLVYTWRDVVHDGHRVVDEIRRAVAEIERHNRRGA